MKVAVIGSRNLAVENIGDYLPEGCDEIVSGGARGVDECGARLADKMGIPLTEFLPDYSKYGRAAPIVRNKQIVEYSDMVIAFWNGSSRGTKFSVDYAKKIGKPVRVIYV